MTKIWMEPIDPHSEFNPINLITLDIPPLSQKERAEYGLAARHATPLKRYLAEALNLDADHPTITTASQIMDELFGGDAAQGKPVTDAPDSIMSPGTRILFDNIEACVSRLHGTYLGDGLAAQGKQIINGLEEREFLRNAGDTLSDDKFHQRDREWISQLSQAIKDAITEENFVKMLTDTVKLLAKELRVTTWQEIITKIYGEDSPIVTHLKDLMEAIETSDAKELQKTIYTLRASVCDAETLRYLENLAKNGYKFSSWQELLRFIKINSPSLTEEDKRGESKPKEVKFEGLAPAIQNYLHKAVVTTETLPPGNAFTLQQPGQRKPGAIIFINPRDSAYTNSVGYHELVHTLTYTGGPWRLDHLEEHYAMGVSGIIDNTNSAVPISRESLNKLHLLALTVAELRLIKLLMEEPDRVTYNRMEELYKDSFHKVYSGLSLYADEVQDRKLMLEVIIFNGLLADVPLMAASHLDFGEIKTIITTAEGVFRRKGVTKIEDQILYYLATVAYMSSHGGLYKNPLDFKVLLESIIDKGAEEANNLIQKLIDREIILEEQE